MSKQVLRPVLVSPWKKEPYRAYFHAFFQSVESDDCAYPVAVVEQEDGTVQEIATTYIRFLDRDEGKGDSDK